MSVGFYFFLFEALMEWGFLEDFSDEQSGGW
jgi:hypothetical protein